MSKVVVILSGGMDSATLVYKMKSDRHNVLALSFNYAQRHLKELGAASSICSAAGVSHQIADLSDVAHLFAGDSALCNIREDKIPDGHYTDESMKATVVPNRNMIMLSIAGGYAIAQKAEVITYGAHAGDHAIYPDCRIAFYRAMRDALSLCNDPGIQFTAPFVGMTKAEICEIGAALGVPFNLTWSCYRGSHIHCGTCGTCVERREAFRDAKVADPTEYAQ